jgi:hypothetical protein
MVEVPTQSQCQERPSNIQEERCGQSLAQAWQLDTTLLDKLRGVLNAGDVIYSGKDKLMRVLQHAMQLSSNASVLMMGQAIGLSRLSGRGSWALFEILHQMVHLQEPDPVLWWLTQGKCASDLTCFMVEHAYWACCVLPHIGRLPTRRSRPSTTLTDSTGRWSCSAWFAFGILDVLDALYRLFRWSKLRAGKEDRRREAGQEPVTDSVTAAGTDIKLDLLGGVAEAAVARHFATFPDASASAAVPMLSPVGAAVIGSVYPLVRLRMAWKAMEAKARAKAEAEAQAKLCRHGQGGGGGGAAGTLAVAAAAEVEVAGS